MHIDPFAFGLHVDTWFIKWISVSTVTTQLMTIVRGKPNAMTALSLNMFGRHAYSSEKESMDVIRIFMMGFLIIALHNVYQCMSCHLWARDLSAMQGSSTSVEGLATIIHVIGIAEAILTSSLWQCRTIARDATMCGWPIRTNMERD